MGLIKWILIATAVVVVAVMYLPQSEPLIELDIGQVVRMAQSGLVSKIQVQGDLLRVTATSGKLYKAQKETGVTVFEMLEQKGVDTVSGGVVIEVRNKGVNFISVVLPFLPLLFFAAVIFWVSSRARGGFDQASSWGKSGARENRETRPSVTLDDVAGVDEAKQELMEIVEFLQHPDKFARLGAKIPRGVLLAGPPGTGKTLLSRAVAGEADAPFFSITGSEFVEMFVGVGASRVRDLFKKARQAAPSIIFIDEIDAVGRHRGTGIGGGHDEREQTLNQILSEMDGFDERTNVIVLAATNRPDVLDPALLRPGRFDRRIVLPLPDAKGREAILKIHSKGKPLAKNVDLSILAKQTYGFSGADLANLVNEGAILAARQDEETIGLADLEESIDRILAGPARKSRGFKPKEKKIVAYHEAGHALVAAYLPEADPVHKVTIVPRSGIGGYTRTFPEEDRDLWSKGQFEAMLAMMMGGQAAEELVFGDITTGASNDLLNASRVARKMVTEYGMSVGLGPRSFHTGQEMVFLGKELAQGHEYSDAVAEKIDTEIGALLNSARTTADEILSEHRERLNLLANKLVEEESLEGAALRELLLGPIEELSEKLSNEAVMAA
ncbi:MAG: ATP-dependent zinc metalloprotease FtsH [SAR202 cluster bacterium]|nr:ATP-dependent zinc metalloprotease FtsH [SAR202 cluster bacterium]